ncbi:MAG: TetR/AcrR family transcriptional regulator [Clostridia bacterium]|nr:MAG: TetR/AcrR family transcriptional regulator [Clostridia bacterium]
MNGKFFALPEEKRQRIINAGFRVFSSGAYKKCPVAEIAAEAGISKSLLFHYFRDKLELYMFLWDEAARLTMEYLNRYGCYEPGDLFEMMERGMRAKLEIMRNYPAMAAFSIRAFYEKEPNLQAEIQESYKKYFGMKAEKALAGLDPEKFIPGLDLGRMYREMYLASVGYLWESVQWGKNVEPERLEADFKQMLDFWKSVYLRREE